MANKFRKDKNQSIITKTLQEKTKKSVNDADLTSNFKVSFQYMDTTQEYASSFSDWKDDLLVPMMETLKGFCSQPLLSLIGGNKKFVPYTNGFPSAERTKFSKPQHVPLDAHWARIHINNCDVIVGHYVSDTFYVVFLDRGHNFYLTKKNLAGN